MALVTLVVVLALVHIIAAMAGITIPNLVFAAGHTIFGRMTVVAGHATVAALERVVGVLVVIKSRFIPGFFLVAILAIAAESVGMHIANFMAVDTLFRRVLIFAADVTGVAVDLLVRET